MFWGRRGAEVGREDDLALNVVVDADVVAVVVVVNVAMIFFLVSSSAFSRCFLLLFSFLFSSSRFFCATYLFLFFSLHLLTCWALLPSFFFNFSLSISFSSLSFSSSVSICKQNEMYLIKTITLSINNYFECLSK